MVEKLQNFIDEAIKLELNLARLYGTFAEYVEEDYAFWFRLEIEEKNHASLLMSGKDFVEYDHFPKDLLPTDISLLEETNIEITKSLDDFIKNPNRKQALKVAIKFEESAGEIHFQQFMDSKSDGKLVKLFQKLNRMDKDHAKRIIEYLDSVETGAI